MIVTDKFVHYHLPRTGGTAFAKLCRKFLREQIKYEKETFSWIVPPEFSEDLTDVITVRSLPSWIMSYNLSQQRGLDRIKEVRKNTIEGKILYKNDWFYVDDLYADKLNCIDLSKTIIIRQENLLQDFDNMLQSLYGMSIEGYKLKETLKKLSYPKFMLTEEDVDTIYNSNPIWKKLEKEMYES